MKALRSWDGITKDFSVILGIVILLVATSQTAIPTYGQPQNSPIVQTPAGPTHLDCVHEILNGSAIIGHGVVREPNGTVVVFHDCPDPVPPNQAPSACNGFDVEDERYNYTNPALDFFRGTWSVPAAPTNQGSQLIYMWVGLEPTSCSWVMQSVIQWGYSTASGGGNYWQAESWFFETATMYYFSTPIRVNVGDSMFGDQSGTPCTNGICNWSIYTQDQSIPNSSAFTCANTNYVCGLQAQQSVVALEMASWGTGSCSNLPGHSSSPTTFTTYQESTSGSGVVPSWSGFFPNTNGCSGLAVGWSNSGTTSYVYLWY